MVGRGARAALALCVGLVAASLLHCGSSGGAPGGPQITEFAFVGQLPSDPLTGIFSVTFSSPDGTLGGGKATFLVDGASTPLTLEMADLFAQVGLPQDATSGEIGPVLRFSSTVPNGSHVGIACTLYDSKNRASNTAQVTLQFTY